MGFFSRFFGPPTEDQFARLFQKTLAQVGSKRVTTYDKEQFRLTHDDGFTNLRNFYIEYCKLTGRDRRVYLSRACLLMAQQPDSPKDFEDARHDLLPTIRSRAMLDEVRLQAEISGSEWKGLPAWPVSEHLMICLVYDLPTAMQFVNDEMLAEWGVSLYEAVEVAKENLEQRESVIVSVEDSFYVVSTGDAYDATRMILIDKIRKLAFEGDPIALPITRETLLLTGVDDKAGLALMIDLAEKSAGESRPICPIAHRLVGDEWEPWLPAPDSPLYSRFRLLEVQFLGGAYNDQKQLFDKRHEHTGEDVFVASFSGIKRAEGIVTYSVWTKGVASWLPRTDYVGLNNVDTNVTFFVRWEELQSHVGELLEPLEMYPPRWFVDDFPMVEQIEAMHGEDWSK